MTHLFVDPADMTGDTLIITGADYNHIKNVLRMRPGDELSVSNGTDSREYRYGIEEIREDGIVCRLRFIKEADVELPVRMTLFQGLPGASEGGEDGVDCAEMHGARRLLHRSCGNEPLCHEAG